MNNKKKQFRKSFFVFLITQGILISSLLAPFPSVKAQEGIIINFISQTDYNYDGKPDITVIESAFVTDHDIIYVVDQGNDMQLSTNWQEATDFKNDIWLYDIGGNGTIQLIVVYGVEDGHDTAYVYDDRDGDGNVSYKQNGTQITINESEYWSARISSLSTWYLPDKSLNLNVLFELDSPFDTFFAMPDWVRIDYMKFDGVVDLEFELVAADGIAQYAIKRLLTPIPDYFYFQRSAIYSNDGGFKTIPYPLTFFPFILPTGLSQGEKEDLRWFDFPPYIVVDWEIGKIKGIALEGAPIGHGYSCNNFTYLEKNKINDVIHECPLAYYDLEGNLDPFPELNIRLFQEPIGISGVPTSDEKIQEVYYSWNQFNPGTLCWDYKFGFAGNNIIESVEQIHEYMIRMVPYEELPDWIAEQTWNLTTFVAQENGSSCGTEGIWDWGALRGENPVSQENPTSEVMDAATRYTQGVIIDPPISYFTNIRNGLRGEYNFRFPAKPRLYFSPVDHELHMIGAQWGIWNIDDLKTIEYRDRDNDGYFDEWLYLNGGILQRHFNVTPEYLIYYGEGEVVLKLASIAPSLFEALPPGDHDQWLALGEKLDKFELKFIPGDFRSMLLKFEGDALNITGASIRDFRTINGGFRFILNLREGFDYHGEDFLGLKSRDKGEYVVTYDGSFQLQPSIPPALSLNFLPLQSSQDTPTQLMTNNLSIDIVNKGLVDAQQVLVKLGMAQTGDEFHWTEPLTVTVHAGESVPLQFPWTPKDSGTWKIQVQANLLDDNVTNNVIATIEQNVEVQAAQSPTFQQEIGAFGIIKDWQFYVLVAALLIAVMAMGWFLIQALIAQNRAQE